MQALDRPFAQIINGATQFVIPVFQRDYSWTDAQCEQLWRDVLKVARADAGHGHFLGSVVYVPTADTSAGFTRWLLIDGQQRVTTLTLMLTALRDHIRETGWTGTEDDPTPKRLDAYFLKNLQEEGAREHKLVLRRHDRATLQAIVDGAELPADAAERIQENYGFFRDQMAHADPAEVYRGIGRLIVVDVTLDRATDNPQMIFESLNSTGIDLSQSDLIRNFVLMRLDEREQTRLYETYWSKIEALFRGSETTFDSFARDYVALKTRASKQGKADEIYQGFRRAFDDLSKELDGLEGVLADMLRFARYHAAFSLGVDGPEALRAPLTRLRKLVDVPATLVMQLFDRHDRLKTLTESDFVTAIELIESYVFRRAICGEQTRGYWRVFALLAYGLEETNPLESLKVGFARQPETNRFPSNADFQKSLEDRDIYQLRACGHLLDRLENHENKEPTDTSVYTIEHILPQNPNLPEPWRRMLGEGWAEIQKEWLHRLGNLTLTGYNSKYSDRPFSEKKTIDGGFSESSVRLNRFVREQDVWTGEQIAQRGRELARRSQVIWPPLSVDPAAIEAARREEMRALAAKRDVDKVKMDTRARELFRVLSARVLAIDEEILELAETRSISYHGPSFFLEVLPRKNRLALLLPPDFNEIDDPTGLAEDATRWKFFFYAKYDGGVSISVASSEDIDRAMPVIRQAHSLAST